MTQKNLPGSARQQPILASAYAVVPDHEQDVYYGTASVYPSFVAPGAASLVELDHVVPHSPPPEYTVRFPEAQGLTWEDDFFDDEDGILAVFDFDYKAMESYYSKIGWGCLLGTCFCPNIFTAALLCLVPCHLDKNISWNVRAQHVAITTEGIRFIHDRRPTCWGQPCMEASKTTKTIPFDKITDCDVREAAGNTCLVIRNTLHSVSVDTSNSKDCCHELNLVGLKDPHGFKRLILAMKRRLNSGNTSAAAAAAAVMVNHSMERLTATVANVAARNNSDSENVATLLREIRDELRQHNQALQSLQQQQQQPVVVTVTAPTEN